MPENVPKEQIEQSIKQEFEETLADRVARHLQMSSCNFAPSAQFSAASFECSLLFRDGYFYACIALTQSIADSLTRSLCHKNGWEASRNFQANVEKLCVRGIISDKAGKVLVKIWEKGNDYYNLNPNLAPDRRALEDLAREKIRLLAEAEKEIY